MIFIYFVSDLIAKTIRLKMAVVAKNFRHRLADENALLPLALMGIITGLLSGLVIQAFRFLIEWPSWIWNNGNHEAFEMLSVTSRLALPLYGALTLGLFLQFIIKNVPSMGLPHVVQRLNNNHGRLSLRPAIMQFLIGIWCLLTGQSSGREGPAIHLGAAVSSYSGQVWRLPSNSIRVLAGCGAAAAIAASFNTPIAGVIFAMEVVLLEYTLAGFIPIMLAASAGTVISRLVYGDAPAFAPQIMQQHSLLEVPAFIILGLGIGLAAALFCFIQSQGLRLHKIPLWLRFTLAGLFTGAVALYLPEVMGIGYDTVDLALQAQMGLYLLLAIGIAKLLTAAVSSGMGMPIGVIGPSLVSGACLGGALGIGINFIAPDTIANDSLYVMIGMGAMMGAVMNAPLAALTALLELTNTPDIILPGMIAIVVATLTNTQIFKQKPPHLAALHSSGKSKQLSVFEQALQRVGISSLSNSHVISCMRTIEKQQLQKILLNPPRWLVVETLGQPSVLLAGHQLIQAFNDDNEGFHSLSDDSSIDMLATPGEQLKLANLDNRSSALEAWQIMEQENVDALLISSTFDAYAPAIISIVTRQDIENFYHKPRTF